MEGVTIPIIDISAFASPNASAEQRAATAKEVRHACEHVGFMYLRSSGFDPSAGFAASRAFFALPAQVKESLNWEAKEVNMGYVAPRRERLDPTKPGDLKEAYNIAKPQKMSWPPQDAFPGAERFAVEGERFFREASQLALCVLDAFEAALELPAGFLRSRHLKLDNTLRFLHYPPLSSMGVSAEEAARLQTSRAGAHSDYGSITLLFQDDVGGLEVMQKSGTWLPATPIPNTVLVNTGDLMMRWTGDLFKSTVHRVVIPTSPTQQERERFSIALFVHPDDETMIETLPTCLQRGGRNYPPITALSYLLERLKQTY